MTLKGVPVSLLVNPATARIARELDENPFIQRSNSADKADGVLSREELDAALVRLDSFTPPQQAALRELAGLMGASPSSPSSSTPRAWAVRAPLADVGGVHAHAAVGFVAAGKDLFAVTGHQHINFSRYSPGTDTWTSIPRPHGVYGGWVEQPTIAGSKDALYSLGGVSAQQIWGNTFRYDTATKDWKELPEHTPRMGSALAVSGADLYLLGGVAEPKDHGPCKSTKTAQWYDSANNTWKKLPAMPVARLDASAIVHDGKLYVVGGLERQGGQSFGTPSNRVDIFDIAQGKWLAPLRAPTPAVKPSLGIIDGKIAVMGGEGDAGRANGAVDLLDPRAGTWSDHAALHTGDNRWMRAAVVEGRLFSLGGKGDAPVLEELAAPPTPAPTSVTLVDVRNTVVNNSVHNEVHQHITTVNVKLEVLLKHVTNVVSLHNSQSTTVVNNVDVDVLAPLATPSFVGVTDPDAGFFLRTAHQQKPMLQRAEGPDGNSYLVGRCVDGKAPAPKNATLVFTHPATQTSLQVRTDDRGQFAIPVTGLSGPAFVGLAGSGVAELALD